MSCSKLKKNDCKSPCEWIKGKGCRTGTNKQKSKSKSVSPKHSPKKIMGCSKLKKNDCKSPCEWIKGKGCRTGTSKSPLKQKSKSPEKKYSSSHEKFNIDNPTPDKNSSIYKKWLKWFIAPAFMSPEKIPETESFRKHRYKAVMWILFNSNCDEDIKKAYEEKLEQEEREAKRITPSKKVLLKIIDDIIPDGGKQNKLLSDDIYEDFGDIPFSKLKKFISKTKIEKFLSEKLSFYMKKKEIHILNKKYREDFLEYFSSEMKKLIGEKNMYSYKFSSTSDSI